MSADWQADVTEFHAAMGLQIGAEPQDLDRLTKNLRANLELEELRELHDATEQGDLLGIMKESIDLIYVVLGRCVSSGLDLSAAWDAVHAANMRKAGGPRRGDGKVLKPEGWEPAKLVLPRPLVWDAFGVTSTALRILQKRFVSVVSLRHWLGQIQDDERATWQHIEGKKILVSYRR